MAKPEITPGDYAIAGRAYRAEATATGIRLRLLRRNGKPAADVLAHVHGDSVQLTTNGKPHACHLMALAVNPAVYQVAAHCAEPGCGRPLTDPVSIATGRGPEHRVA